MNNSASVKTAPNQSMDIPKDAFVTVYSTGNYNELVYSQNQSKQVPASKISSSHYVDKTTGEIKSYEKNLTKPLNALRKPIKNIIRYIKGCFVGDNSERFLTLTYDAFVDDHDKIADDIKAFFRKLTTKYPDCQYLYIKEPNESGQWHVHCIVKRKKHKLFSLTEEEIRKMWGQGSWVKVQRIENIDTLCWYFDIFRNPAKAARIEYYPSNIRIFGHSRDMKLTKQRLKYEDALKAVSEENLIYKSGMNVVMVCDDGSERIINKIGYEQYKDEDGSCKESTHLT